MAQHGGKRLGSGRKKGSIASHTLEAQEIRICLIKKVIKEKGPIVRALVNKAKKGDIAALREVLDRTIGKVRDQLDIDANSKRDELMRIQDGVREIIESAKKKDTK
jgi:hypothetical protein